MVYASAGIEWCNLQSGLLSHFVRAVTVELETHSYKKIK